MSPTPLERHPLPGLPVVVGVPTDWLVTKGTDVALIAVEPSDGGFASSLTVLVQPGAPAPVPDPALAATAALVAPVVLDAQSREQGRLVDVLVSHVAGGVAVTAQQRQLFRDQVLVVATVTVATCRWAAGRELAADLLAAVQVTA